MDLFTDPGPALLGSGIDAVLHEPGPQLPHPPGVQVKDELVIAMENVCEDRISMKEKLNEVAKDLEIESILDRDMMYLSSRKKQKVTIGSVFYTHPKGFV